MDIYEKIPESAKLTTAMGPAALGLFGIPLSEWVLILSIVVSLLVIIEKLPKAWNAVRRMLGKSDDKTE